MPAATAAQRDGEVTEPACKPSAEKAGTACLLLHGFAGTPFEVEPLAGPLLGMGLHVDMPLLPGHGTSLQDFRATFFPHWLQAACSSYEALAATHERVFVIGFSMGGALALILASRYAVAGVAALATPLWLYRLYPWRVRDFRLLLLPVLQYFVPTIVTPRRGGESQKISPSQGYEECLPLAQLHSLGKGFAKARRALPAVTAPLLIVQDVRDRIVGPDAGAYIAERTASMDVTLRLTHIQENLTGKHMITTHRETREQVAGWCTEFVSGHDRPAAGAVG